MRLTPKLTREMRGGMADIRAEPVVVKSSV